METLWQDLRFGGRLLIKQIWGYTLIAIVILALGIGATSTIFSFVNGILLRPLPYPEQERLAVIWESSPQQGLTTLGASFPNYLDWREQNRVFENLEIWFGGYFALIGDGEPEQLIGARVSHGLFEMLRVAPSLGRTFTAEEGLPGQDAVVILSHGLWQRRFGGDRNIIGQKITINNSPRTVIGVMPLGFKFPDVRELWVPLALDAKVEKRDFHRLGTIARLKDGVSFEQAQTEMSAIARRIEEENPVTNKGLGVSVTSLHKSLVGDYHQALLILLGVVSCVLLVACANVANLMLARATARQKEVAVRAALGASRWRIIRQLLTESLLLGLMGGLLGLALARLGTDLLLAAIPVELPFWMNFNLDWRVLSFTLGVSLLTVVVFGVTPAIQASQTDLSEALKEGGRSVAAIGSHRSLKILVVVEIALSFALLVGAGLMIQGFLHLQQVNPGFNPQGVLTMKMTLPLAKYSEPEQRSHFFRQLMEQVRALPGVKSAGAISNLPLGGSWRRTGLTVEGQPMLSVTQAPMVVNNVVTPGYFQAFGIPILMGRDFTEADAKGVAKVTIVDDQLAREYWQDESPIGKRVLFQGDEQWYTIVGVVGSVRRERLNADADKTVYVSYLQDPSNIMSLTVLTTGNPLNLISAVRSQIREIDPDQPVIEVKTMEEIMAQSVWQPRLYTILFGVFAAIALLLATFGIYGVMTYTVNMRTHEIGVRMALGATPRNILKLVVGQGMWMTFGGVAIGLFASLALTRLLKSLLFNISTTDLLTFSLVAVLLTTVGFLACYVPAKRAARVDPMKALR